MFSTVIENSKFSGISSNRIGGTIFVNDVTVAVSMRICSFVECSTTGIGKSNIRTNDVCGGACYFNICELEIKSISFVECTGNGVGSSMYIYTPKTNSTNAYCITAHKCGSSVKTITSIICFDCTASCVRNLNFTNSIAKHNDGSIHFGYGPTRINAMFLALIMDQSIDESYALGITYENGDSAIFSHVYIEGSKSNTGIISLWKGQFSFDNAVFYSCTGKLICNREGTTIQITFKNAHFGALDTSGITTKEGCSTDSKTTRFNFHCRFYKNNNHSCANNIYSTLMRLILTNSLTIILCTMS
jgi:hypothetical protein